MLYIRILSLLSTGRRESDKNKILLKLNKIFYAFSPREYLIRYIAFSVHGTIIAEFVHTKIVEIFKGNSTENKNIIKCTFNPERS